MPNYGDPKYWDKRYQEQDGIMYDWLEKYDTLRNIIKESATKDAKVLNIGCGNAEISENMYDDGYLNITNIDISPVVIEQMAKRSMSRPLMKFKVIDACKMNEVPDSSFNLVIDKGTSDSLLCSEKSSINVANMMKVVA